MRISDWSSDVCSSDRGQLQVTADSFDVAPAPGVPPKVRHEIIRIGPGTACKGKDCGTPALMSAFRWNGLNLATVDKQLGRYFGTDHGVLVLSNGELAGLQAGRSEEHTSELPSLMRISYAVFCLKKKHIIVLQHARQ